MIDKMKKGLDSDAVITFLCAENAFHTKYHYGAIEGTAWKGKTSP